MNSEVTIRDAILKQSKIQKREYAYVLLTITVQNINPICVQWLLFEGRIYTQTDATPFCMISQHLSLVRCHQLPAAQLYRRSIEDRTTTVKY